MYVYIYIHIYNDHCCCLEPNHDVTCRGNGTRFAPEREQSIDRGGDADPQCRRPLPFPLTCQHRRNISRRVEVYGSRKRRDSMTQTTTTVSAGIPARMQKSMDRVDAVPRCRRPLPFLLTCQNRRNISRRVEVYGSRERRDSMTQTTTFPQSCQEECRSLWIGATRLHDADDHCHFR